MVSFVALVAKQLEVRERQAREVVGAIVEALVQALDETRSVELGALGSFDVDEHPPRTLVNPQTGEQIEIRAYKLVRFARGHGPHSKTLLERLGELQGKRAEEILDAFVAAIGATLDEKGSVNVPKLGTFTSRERRARTGRNPATGAPIEIPAVRTITFKPDPKLVERIRFTKELPPELRPPRSTWKSVVDLEEEDFAEHPLWGFDLGRGESEPGADESFVRPYESVEASAPFSTTYFARARVVLKGGSIRTGVLTFHFESAEPVVESLGVFGAPSFSIPVEGGTNAPHVMASLAAVASLFPLRYEVRVPSDAGAMVKLSAELDPLRPEQPAPRAPDAYDVATGLGRLEWSDDETTARSRYPAKLVKRPARGIRIVVERFLEVEGVALTADVTFVEGRVGSIMIQPPATRPEAGDLAQVQRTLARRLGCDRTLRIPGLNMWTIDRCELQFVSHGPESFACVVTRPR